MKLFFSLTVQALVMDLDSAWFLRARYTRNIHRCSLSAIVHGGWHKSLLGNTPRNSFRCDEKTVSTTTATTTTSSLKSSRDEERKKRRNENIARLISIGASKFFCTTLLDEMSSRRAKCAIYYGSARVYYTSYRQSCKKRRQRTAGGGEIDGSWRVNRIRFPRGEREERKMEAIDAVTCATNWASSKLRVIKNVTTFG